MEKLALSFLVMMNPFAQFLYMKTVIDDLNLKTFAVVYGKASLMSYMIYVIFSYIGEALFTDVMNISFEAFRIFGGIIIFTYAFLFIIKGTKGMLQLKENLDDLASEIALPFIVGAGTIYLSILIGAQSESLVMPPLVIALVLIINYSLVFLFAFVKDHFKRRQKIAFDKYIGIAMRLNGFLMGALGIHMVLDGLVNFFQFLN